jgi:AcrR family transcriptional regulator
MGPKFLSREQTLERERILDAMVRCVARAGYEATTVEAVIEEASVSLVAFANHFRSKEDCYVQATDAGMARVAERLLSSFNRDGSWRDRLRSAAYAFLEWTEEEPDTARFGFVEIFRGPPRALEHRDRYIDALTDLVDAGRQKLPDPESVPRSIARAIVGAIDGTVSMHLVRGEADKGPVLLPQLLCLALMPYIGTEAALEELHRTSTG